MTKQNPRWTRVGFASDSRFNCGTGSTLRSWLLIYDPAPFVSVNCFHAIYVRKFSYLRRTLLTSSKGSPIFDLRNQQLVQKIAIGPLILSTVCFCCHLSIYIVFFVRPFEKTFRTVAYDTLESKKTDVYRAKRLVDAPL